MTDGDLRACGGQLRPPSHGQRTSPIHHDLSTHRHHRQQAAHDEGRIRRRRQPPASRGGRTGLPPGPDARVDGNTTTVTTGSRPRGSSISMVRPDPCRHRPGKQACRRERTRSHKFPRSSNHTTPPVHSARRRPASPHPRPPPTPRRAARRSCSPRSGGRRWRPSSSAPPTRTGL